MTDPTKQPRDGQTRAGFTLLELLIVLVIFGLIMSTLTQGALFARKAWNTQEQIVDKQGDLMSLQNFLRPLLQSAKKFTGDEKSLRFESRLPHALASQGLFDVELRMAGDRLVLAWRSHVDDATSIGMTEAELATGIKGLVLSYSTKGVKHQAEGWQKDVQDPLKPPTLIRLDLLLPDTDTRHWPSLTVAPRIDATEAKS